MISAGIRSSSRPPSCWKYVNCVISIPSHQTSQPSPQAPTVGCSQSSSTKRMSCLLGVEADRAQRLEVELEHVGGLRLQDHLVLEVVLEAHRVLAVAPVERPDHRLEVRGLPRLRPEAAQEGRRVHRPGGDLGVVRRQQHAAVVGPVLLERQDDLLVRSLRHGRSSYGPLAHGVIRVRGAARQPARRSARAAAARLGARRHVAALPVAST